MDNRIRNLRALLREERLDAFLVTNLSNIRYLCGYTGSNGILVVTRRESRFYTDFRYQEQAGQEVKGAKVKVRERDLIADFPAEALTGVKRLGFEKSFLNFGAYLNLRRQLRKIKLVPAENLVARLRRNKDAGEIELVARAAAVNDRVFQGLLPMVKPGVTEKDLAVEADYRYSRYEGPAFPTIVASGPRGALPHARPGARKLRNGDAVVFDMGVRVQGYCCDMTRTVFVGRAGQKGRRIYEIVLEAQMRALGGVRAGRKASEIDALARDHIREQGFGPQFGHGLGHGVGLDVHEQPGLSSRSKDVLAEGNVVTIEPGIYLPDWGGVRIEDLVVVTRAGCRILSSASKKLQEL
jgi:Xaa-Pro aminopeptidase